MTAVAAQRQRLKEVVKGCACFVWRMWLRRIAQRAGVMNKNSKIRLKKQPQQSPPMKRITTKTEHRPITRNEKKETQKDEYCWMNA